MDTHYQLISPELKIEFDSRSPDRILTPGSGLRLEAFFSYNIDPNDSDLSFLRYGGEISAFWDFSGINHVLSLSIYTEALERIGDTIIPAPARVILGGNEHLRGFLEGHFHGDSALVFTLDYRYPVWTFLDASLFSSVGNVFGEHYRHLDFKRMVLCWGFGLRSNTSREVSFDMLVGFGSNPFEEWDDNFNLDNVRIVFGINQGF